VEIGVYQTCLNAVQAYAASAQSIYTLGNKRIAAGKKRPVEGMEGNGSGCGRCLNCANPQFKKPCVNDDESFKKQKTENGDAGALAVRQWCAEVSDAMQLLWSKVTVPVDDGNKIGVTATALLGTLKNLFNNKVDAPTSATRKALVKSDFFNANEAAAICFSTENTDSTSPDIQMATFIQGLECAQRIRDVSKPVNELKEKQDSITTKLSMTEATAKERNTLMEEQTNQSLTEVDAGIAAGNSALKELRMEEARLMKALKLVQADMQRRTEALKTLTGERSRLRREQTKGLERSEKRSALFEEEHELAEKDTVLAKQVSEYLDDAASAVTQHCWFGVEELLRPQNAVAQTVLTRCQMLLQQPDNVAHHDELRAQACLATSKIEKLKLLKGCVLKENPPNFTQLNETLSSYRQIRDLVVKALPSSSLTPQAPSGVKSETAVFYHTACLQHLVPEWHPESPKRLDLTLTLRDPYPDPNAQL